MRPITRPCHLARFAREEDGGITSMSIILLIGMFIVAGLAVDVADAVRTRTDLQVAADTAAHAALYTRDKTPDEEVAAAAGLDMAQRNMPVAVNGVVLVRSDLEFGVWDPDTRVFTPQPGSPSAVRTRTRRAVENGNAVNTLILKFAGVNTWDLRRESIFETYYPPCFREGFVAETLVDIQSNNSYYDGFCIHSNDEIKISSNNFFETGTVVSLPELANLQIPKSGFETNEGLAAALRYGEMPLRILDELPALIEALKNPTSDKQHDYIDPDLLPRSLSVVNGNPRSDTQVKDLAQVNLSSNQVHVMNCNTPGAQVNVKSGTQFRSMVLVTNCSLKFESGVSLEDTVIATTSTDVRSINAPSGLRLGNKDGCTPGGGAQLLTLGGVSVASDLEMYGAQIIAKSDIQFAARADGMEGAAMVSGTEVSGTSNMNMGFCNKGMEDNFQADYFRMVQ